MNTELLIGNVALDISTAMYLSYYIPQLWHNRQVHNLRELSIQFHLILLLAYITDLIYGFGMSMPWQYRLVSAVGTCYLIFQHIQLWRLYYQDRRFQGLTIGVIAIVMTSFVLIVSVKLPVNVYLGLEYFSQLFGIVYTLPQLIRNFNLSSADSLSIFFILMNLVSAVCDNLSSWLLAWPLPNKIGAGIRVLLVVVLMLQWFYYRLSKKRLDPMSSYYERI